MPTAELIQPKQAGPPGAALADDDVEALLSQADALLNDVQANLGEMDADGVATANEVAIHDMAEEITTSADNADTDAIMAMLNQRSSEEGNGETVAAVPSADVAKATDEVNDVDTVEVAVEAATPVPAPTSPNGPQSNLDEQLYKVDISDDHIPSIPDDKASTPQDTSNYVAAVAASVAATDAVIPTKRFGRAIRWILRRLVRLPLDILILLDRPFAWMDRRTKSFIGYAAISTTVVAIATWVYGNLQHTS